MAIAISNASCYNITLVQTGYYCVFHGWEHACYYHAHCSLARQTAWSCYAASTVWLEAGCLDCS